MIFVNVVFVNVRRDDASAEKERREEVRRVEMEEEEEEEEDMCMDVRENVPFSVMERREWEDVKEEVRWMLKEDRVSIPDVIANTS